VGIVLKLSSNFTERDGKLGEEGEDLGVLVLLRTGRRGGEKEFYCLIRKASSFRGAFPKKEEKRA